MSSKTKRLLQLLAPYGTWPHPKGDQIVDGESAKKMGKRARSLFSAEIPIYVGHPDETSKDCRDMRVGRIAGIMEGNDGIFVSAVYDEQTYAKIIGGELPNMSPRWEMERMEDGKYRPVRLISVGLTSNPNIPESGKIIRALTPPLPKSLKSKSEKISAVEKRCSEIGRRLSDSARALADMITCEESNRLNKRLKNMGQTESSKEKNLSKISMKELSKAALDFSLKTGQPYTKSFARLRREINTNK